MNTESEVHKRLLRLIGTPMGSPFEYEVRAGTGNSSVQSLRVYLSRVRSKLKEYGKEPAPFKVIVVKVERKKDAPHIDVVTLMRTTNTLESQTEMQELTKMFNIDLAKPGNANA